MDRVLVSGACSLSEGELERRGVDDGDGGSLACEDARRVWAEVMGERRKRETQEAETRTPKRQP